MLGLGTIINVIAIIVGGFIGLLLRNHFKEHYKSVMIQAIGLATLVVGLSGSLQYIFKLSGLAINRVYILEMIVLLVIGSVIGTFLKIEKRLNDFGHNIQHKLGANSGLFAKGFVTATLIFCVGAMAITGSIEDGLTGNASTLIAKSALDGMTAMILASTLGIGVIFSFIPVLIYQGLITILAYFLGSFLELEAISLMSIIGNVLIIGISLELLEIKKVKVADMLPAILLPILYFIIINW
jgi:uncharacterized protein